MIPEQAPDYSKYTLDELHDVARHIDRERYAERYVLVRQQIALRHREAPWQEQKPPQRPLREWLFEPGNTPRTAKNIIAWWEVRRAFWCSFVTFLLYSSLSTCALLLLLANRSDVHISFAGVLSAVLVTLVAFIFSLVWLLFAMIPINIAFFCTYLFDIALSWPLKFLGWRLSVALFAALLAVTILAAALPIVGLVVEMTHK